MSYRILIVDDSKIVRSVIKKTINLCAADVSHIHEAANGKEALEKIEESSVNLVFLDVNMPVMNGIEMMESLRSDERFKDLPVVVISTEGSQQRINRLKELGVRDFLRKPFTPEQIGSLLKDYSGDLDG